MCLTKFSKFDCPDCGIGYKVFDYSYDKEIHSPLHRTELNQSYEIGKEYIAEMYDHCKEDCGFYIFLNEQDAIDYMFDRGIHCVFKVKYDTVNSKGYQGKSRCITAEKMTILDIAHKPYEWVGYEDDDELEDWDWEADHDLDEYDDDEEVEDY